MSRLRHDTAHVEVRSSIFCAVREPVPQALCGFYAAAVGRLMVRFGVGAEAEVIACHGMGKTTCVVRVVLARNRRKRRGLMKPDRTGRRCRDALGTAGRSRYAGTGDAVRRIARDNRDLLAW